MVKPGARFFIPALILVAGLAAGGWFMTHPQKAHKRPTPPPQALSVETGRAAYGDYSVTIEAMGQVVPAVETVVRAQVAGQVLSIAPDFEQGGFFTAGAEMLRLDPADYEIAVRKQEAALRQAQAALALEMGRQSVARDELKILERTTGRKPDDARLALRAPQLEQAQAELEKAQADLDAAALALKRTAIAAPFNALVTERRAAPGGRVAAGQDLAVLAGTDEYRVAVSVPAEDLRRLILPGPDGSGGGAVRILPDGGRGERTGAIVRATGALDPQSRMAGLLIGVPDPLLLRGDAPEGDSPLMLGDYVRVAMEGRRTGRAARIPRGWLRGDDTVWLLLSGGTLSLRKVTVVYEDRDYAYLVPDLPEDAAIVSSAIAVPVDGMAIRAAGGE